MMDYEAGARALCEFYGENPDKITDDCIERFFNWVLRKKSERLWEVYASELKREDDHAAARQAADEAMDL